MHACTFTDRKDKKLDMSNSYSEGCMHLIVEDSAVQWNCQVRVHNE
jgi:hypothetical protein